MTFTVPTEDQLSLAQGVAEFFSGNYPLARFRDAEKNAAEKNLHDRWRELARMGVLGISLPERAGGLGLSWLDEALACREAGRYLMSPALIGSILAVQIAARTGQSELRDAVLHGECRAGIAWLCADGLRVVDGERGLFVLVRDNKLALIEPGESSMHPLGCIDDTINLSSATLRAAEPECLDGNNLVLGAHLLLAAMLCGLLEATCAMAANYARTRVQFGRPIGAFQAIKHRCADIALATELCWSQTLQAASALQANTNDAEFHVRSAKLLAGDEALKAARFNIQVHGGMGFTDEVDAHRLMKRAHVLHQLLDDPRLVRPRLIDLTVET